MEVLRVCPVCASRLQYSEMMSYTIDRKIKLNGEMSNKSTKSTSGSLSLGCGFLSCINKKCNFITDCDLFCENHPNIHIKQNGRKFYYERLDE